MLPYAACCWTGHFGKVYHRTDSNQSSTSKGEQDKTNSNTSDGLFLAYYHGLCHPAFPGLDSWLEEITNRRSDEPATLVQWRVPMLDGDKLQDLLIKRLRLEMDGGEDRFGEGQPMPVRGQSQAWLPPGGGQGDWAVMPSQLDFQLNPTALQTFRLPSKVDETGFVSVDFGGVQGWEKRGG